MPQPATWKTRLTGLGQFILTHAENRHTSEFCYEEGEGPFWQGSVYCIAKNLASEFEGRCNELLRAMEDQGLVPDLGSDPTPANPIHRVYKEVSQLTRADNHEPLPPGFIVLRMKPREYLGLFRAALDAPEPDFKPDGIGLEILQALEHSPKTLLQTELEAEIHVSRRTIGPILKQLESVGLVRYPHGRNKGVTITDKGRECLG